MLFFLAKKENYEVLNSFKTMKSSYCPEHTSFLTGTIDFSNDICRKFVQSEYLRQLKITISLFHQVH